MSKKMSNINIKYWKQIKLKAISNNKALWERRYSLDDLEELKSNLGSYWFSALYQQEPSEASCYISRKHFKYFHLNNNLDNNLDNSLNNELNNMLINYSDGHLELYDCSVNFCIDLSATDNEKSDYTVILIFALSPSNQVFILDIIKERMNPAKHLNLIIEQYQKWNPSNIGIEAVQYQNSLVEMASEKGLPVMKLKADRNKTTRLLPMLAKLEAGNVYFNANTSWLNDFENELLQYPNAKNDDQVDTFAYISQMIGHNSNSLPIGRHSGDSLNLKGFNSF